jgi:TonB family protein
MIVAVLLSLASAAQLSQAAKAIDAGEWVTNEDYPAAAIEAGESGTTSFRLDIGKDGAVTRCTVTGSSGSPLLDNTACTLLKMRARFNPALDKKGRPTTDAYSARFRWVLPDAPDIEAGYLISKVTISPDGAITDCSIKSEGALKVEDSEALCEELAGTEAPLLRQLASEYQELRFVVAVSSQEEVFSFEPAGFERTVDRQSGEVYMSEKGQAVRCVSLADTKDGSKFCDAFWSENKRRPKAGEREAKKVTIDRVLYGTPRDAPKKT